MALEDIEGPGKYLGSLNQANPASGDDRREGDNHIRGVKNTLRNTFPNVNGPVTATDTVMNSAMAGDFTTVQAETIRGGNYSGKVGQNAYSIAVDLADIGAGGYVQLFGAGAAEPGLLRLAGGGTQGYIRFLTNGAEHAALQPDGVWKFYDGVDLAGKDLDGLGNCWGNAAGAAFTIAGDPESTFQQGAYLQLYGSGTAPTGSLQLSAGSAGGKIGLSTGVGADVQDRLIIDSAGNTLINVEAAQPALDRTGQMVFNLVDNTTLRVAVRGSDGVTRTANIALA